MAADRRFQLKSGLTSALRLPQAWQTNRPSISDRPEIIGPGIAADRDGVATAVVGAIDQQAADAAFALEEQELPKVRSFLVDQFTLAQREVC